jgi:hypothetical protein
VLIEGEESSMGTISRGDGYFLIAGVVPGDYRLTISFVGYETQRESLALSPGQRLSLEVRMNPDRTILNEVVVESERLVTDLAMSAGTISVRPSDVQRIPLPGLSPDLANYLGTVPGVVTAGDRGGRLYVRGGTPVQNLFLVDGMPIYKPLHIVDFYSAFPADIISHSTVYAGGFGARYGGRLSSVVDVAMRNGSKTRLIGSASLSPFLASMHVEVPIVRDRVSFVASARESLIERTAPRLINQDLPYRFGDRFFKLHAFLSKTSHFSASVMTTTDRGNVAGEASFVRDVRWSNRVIGARYFYLPESYPVFTDLSLSVSRFDMTAGPEGRPEQTSLASGFDAKVNFGYLLGTWEILFGLFGNSTKFNFNLSTPDTEDNTEYIAEGGIFADVHIRPFSALEPRLRLLYRPDRNGLHALSAAWGVFHQQTIGINSERIVTDVFTAWAPTPESGTVPRATHAILGWSGPVTGRLSARVEVYGKFFTDLAFPAEMETLGPTSSFDIVDGSSVGTDVTADWTAKSWHVSAGYGLASVWYEGEAGRFRPPHDRRHHVNLVGGVSWRGFRFTARWQFGSGLPFTQISGFYDSVRPDPDGRAFHTDPGTASVALAEPYNGRLPDYHRLDLQVEKLFASKRVDVTLQAGIINVYDRTNLFDVDLLTGTRVDQLPLVPSAGIRIDLH